MELELQLRNRIAELEAEVARLSERSAWSTTADTVRVPAELRPIFDAAQKTVGEYFSHIEIEPSEATIKIGGERYVLMRASSLSVDFLTTIRGLYAEQGEEAAFAIGRNFLFDISHVIGMEDAKNFHRRMKVNDPIGKLSSGPVHFAYAGWAQVEISPESKPTLDDEFFLKYDHPYSFESDAWIRAGKKSEQPVCIMNAGYSSGWCEQSFGQPLTAVEISCRACGDPQCTFVMAPPNKIEKHLLRYLPESKKGQRSKYDIPTFFQRKRVEEEMQAARKKAEESDRMKSEFLANMSHEIRTPMNSIIGLTELALESDLTSTQREYLTTSLSSAQNLMAIINQILDFSKIGAGKLELESTEFRLGTVVGDAMKSMAHRAQDKGIDLSWKIDPALGIAFRGDPHRLRQILLNLVGNAIKFTDQGKIEVLVRQAKSKAGTEAAAASGSTNSPGALEAVTDGSPPSSDSVTLHFEIRDTGIGIPADKLQTIFQAFTQVDMSSTRRHGGTGLGLTISAELVRKMGGRIWALSRQGRGSIFHFTIRLQPAVRQRQEPPSELADMPILIECRNEKTRRVLKNTLEKLGMNVTLADSPRVALDRLLEQHNSDQSPDLLLADVSHGLELIETIRQHPELQDTTIIALTAGYQPGDLQRFDQLAVDACLHKPLKRSDLLEAIKRGRALHAERYELRRGKSREAPGPVEKTDQADAAVEILLVEDGVANQKFAVAMLSRWGHQVSVANNGREAIEKFQQSPGKYDLILMDVLMPEMDGLEATAAIRKLEQGSGRHIPIVAITAQAMKGDREKCLAAGMDDYMTKPLRRRELQQIIDRRLSGEA